MILSYCVETGSYWESDRLLEAKPIRYDAPNWWRTKRRGGGFVDTLGRLNPTGVRL